MFSEWPVIGHKRTIKSLKNIISNDKLSHAFLFSGPGKIGKTLVAHYFIKTIQCQGGNRPCNTCDSCVKIDKGVHSDVMVLQNDNLLKINDIREVKRKLSLHPNNSEYKICLINNSNNLTREAANALLKILEEPEGKTVIILIADNHEKLLPTVVSRCVLFKLFPPSRNEIKDYFSSKFDNKINDIDLEELLIKTGGRPGEMFSCLKDEGNVSLKREIEEGFADVLFKSNSDFDRLSHIKSIPVKDRQKVAETLDIWLAFCRELLLAKLGLLKINDNKINIENYSLKEAKENILKINEAKKLLSKNINTKLLMENLLLNVKFV